MITRLFKEDKYITELTRSDIIKGITPNFIHHRDYYKDLKIKIGSQPTLQSKNWYLNSIELSKFTFKIKSATEDKFYDNTIDFIEAYNWLKNNFDIKQYDYKSDVGIKKLVNYLKYYFRGAIDTDDIYVFCSCPAFKFYYNYVAFQLDVTKNKENRPAPIRNPRDNGIVCKHLNFSLRSMSDNRNKPYIVEYLVNEFLYNEIHRKLNIPVFWRGYFDYLKLRID